jgi:hypothetical protein
MLSVSKDKGKWTLGDPRTAAFISRTHGNNAAVFFAARASITVGARPGANNACTGAVASMRGKPINIYAEIKVK